MKTSLQFEIGFRSIIGLTFLTLVLGACSGDLSSEDTPSLKEAYQNDFRIGAALGPDEFNRSDTAAVAIIEEHFNTITPENVMKPGPINPEPGEFNFGPADGFVEFGEENEMFMVGHTLVWHSQTPDWFFHDEQGNPLGRDAQIERMRSHIETVAGRYSGKVHAWDVVNEAVLEDGSMRPTLWFENIGEDYVELAFEFARQYAPDAELYYNDYGLANPSKRDGVMRLVRSLQEKGIKVDGIGMQGHWHVESPSLEQIEASIDSFSSLGVQVMITELDVDVLPRRGQPTADVSAVQEGGDEMNPFTEGLPDHMQQALADRYRELFELLYDKRDKIDRVTFWGVSDGDSWKNNFPISGRTNYPLLFDRQYQPKQAFYEAVNVPLR